MKLLHSFSTPFTILFVLASVNNNVQSYPRKEMEESCAHKAFLGECESEPEYMLENCKQECEEWFAEMDDHGLQNITSFYDLSANDIDGNKISFERFRDKLVVIANVASYCSKTNDHYKELVELHQYFKEKGKNAEILAFPCNQFGKQEPDAPATIKKFAKSKGVEFLMMEKVDVNGKDAHKVYKWMKFLAGPYKIKWNFNTYYVIDQEGNVEEYTGITPLELQDELFRYWDHDEEHDEF